MTSYYLSRDGRQFGPFSEHELRGMVSTGQATTTELACLVGTNEWKPLHAFPGFQVLATSGDSPISTVIPYKNPPALFGYYLSVFSLIPVVGLLLAIPAVILGFIGLKKAKESPGSKGTAHAWTALILGGISTLLWGAAVVFIIIGISQGR
jgi:Domain of unknown function (DUF4190)/GYF domain 2